MRRAANVPLSPQNDQRLSIIFGRSMDCIDIRYNIVRVLLSLLLLGYESIIVIALSV